VVERQADVAIGGGAGENVHVYVGMKNRAHRRGFVGEEMAYRWSVGVGQERFGLCQKSSVIARPAFDRDQFAQAVHSALDEEIQATIGVDSELD